MQITKYYDFSVINQKLEIVLTVSYILNKPIYRKVLVVLTKIIKVTLHS